MPATLNESKIYDPYDVYLNDIGDDRFRYNQLHDKIKRLPDVLFDYVFDTKVGDFIKDRMAVPLGLDQNQSKETAKLVMDILLTEWYLGDIVNQIRSKLGVDEQKAKTAAGLIVAELLAPVLEDLKKRHLEKFAKNLPKPQIQNNPPAPSGDDRVVNLKNNP